MRFQFIILVLLMSSGIALQGQNTIQWMTWEEAQVQMQKQPRKIFVDVYTDWCGWCKKMDAATFQQAHIANYINQYYYAVKFNAEQREAIDFNGTDYQFVKQGRRGFHELAAEITEGRLSFPTIVFIDENLDVIQPIPGFRGPDEFEIMMTYFAKNEHLKTPWSVYQKYYEPMPKDKP